MNYKKSKGFTLIELLVVIAIISLLSSVVLAALRDARDKAKMTKFLEEVKQLTLAIELYKSENNNQLPDLNNVIDIEGLFTSSLTKYISDYPKYPFSLNGSYDHFIYANSPDDQTMDSVLCGENNKAGIFLHREEMTQKELEMLLNYGWINDIYNPPPGYSTLGLCLPIYF